ncbi:hypothetical protein BR93DRAFT_936477 [Coniochaeta sp. PMI_546]|nr:hypothetical protein BR93DRAFT_936477 [Coniochaeta sp. PMI_546]
MAYLRPGGASFQQAQHYAPAAAAKAYSVSPPVQPFLDAQFDIFEWHTHFQSCVRYFLDHAQYNGPVQALAAFVNIRLPFQKPNPVLSSRSAGTPPPPPGAGHPGAVGGGVGAAGVGGGFGGQSSSSASSSSGRGGVSARADLPVGHGHHPHHPPSPQLPPHVTLLPYIRRLVATGFDYPAVLHGFFGDDWLTGIGPLHEQERRNYLFAAKSDTWLTVKAAYDMGEEQSIPFLRPLQNVTEKEIVGAEVSWSEWLAMQDWMLGPREPVAQGPGGSHYGMGGSGGGAGSSHGHGRVRVKNEED